MLQSLQTSVVGAEKGEFLNNSFSFRDGYVHTFKDFVALSIFLGDEFRFLKGSIRAAEFYSLLGKFTDDQIELEVEKTSIDVLSGKARASFVYVEDVVLRQVEKMDMDSLQWSPVAEDFREALKFCLLGLREYALEGVRVKGRLAISVDSKRVNYYEMKADMGDFLIEEKVVSELLKFDNVVSFAHSPTRLFLRLTDGTIVSGRKKVDSDYPLNKILATIKKMEQKEQDPAGTLPAAFRQMIGRANVLSIEYSGMDLIHITFDPEAIRCDAHRAIGNYSESVDWEEKPKGLGEPVKVTLESSSTLYALERSKAFYIKEEGGNKRLAFISENSRCYLAAYMIEGTK